MKCNRHPYELDVGVCASCLREGLLALIAAQNGRSPEPRRISVDPPSPPAFPRSVSPYLGHRRSVGSGPSPSYAYLRPQSHCRFFSTPQVGPTSRSERLDGYSYSFCKKSSGSGKNFSLLSTLFGIPRTENKSSSKPSSASWFSGLIPGRRKKKLSSRSQSRSKSFQDRGMSPVRDDEANESVCSSGYSTESSTGWRRPEPTPVRKFPSRRAHGVSDFAVCLSPLVRPSSKPAADLGISGDVRGALKGLHQHRRHVSTGAASLVPSRSRKLADYGRFR